MAVVLASASVATAQPNTDRTPLSCASQTADFHAARAKSIINKAFGLDRLPSPSPSKRSEKNAWREHRRCLAEPERRLRIGRYVDRMQARYERHLEGNWCAPHPDPAGAGCWVIPVSCVMSESGGSWSAYNPSGARGAYQLLSHGEPWPVNSRADAMAHHRIAADLYASYGLQPWVAPGC